MREGPQFWYGCTLWPDGTLYVDPAVFLPAYGWPLPAGPGEELDKTVEHVIGEVGITGFTRLWIHNPALN